MGNGLADIRETMEVAEEKANGYIIFHSRITKSLMSDWYQMFLGRRAKKGVTKKEFWLKSIEEVKDP